MKTLKYNLLYLLVILLSIISVVIPLLGIYLFLTNFSETKQVNMLYLSFLIPLLFTKLLFEARIKLRNIVDYDEFGVSKKYGKYERMSAKEKKVIDMQKMADMERILSSSQIKKLTHKGSENTCKDMKKLIGLRNVKDKMNEMVARMEFERSSKKMQISSKHMAFLGSPGTGKTTVARIMTGFLYQNKYIKKNKCVEVDGNFLKSSTSADTAIKTELIIREALGGVLFIDEAYALIEGSDGIGEQAVATLIKAMEDRKGEFVLILAGYTNEIKKLIQSNPGFESRIKDFMVFQDYNNEELKEIFINMARDNNFVVDANALDKLEERFERERNLSSFGNGRTARNILDECIDKHAFNFKNKEIGIADKFKITEKDVNVYPKVYWLLKNNLFY